MAIPTSPAPNAAPITIFPITTFDPSVKAVVPAVVSAAALNVPLVILEPLTTPAVEIDPVFDPFLNKVPIILPAVAVIFPVVAVIAPADVTEVNALEGMYWIHTKPLKIKLNVSFGTNVYDVAKLAPYKNILINPEEIVTLTDAVDFICIS